MVNLCKSLEAGVQNQQRQNQNNLKFLPPADIMVSAHRTTSSSYSPLFTTRTSMPSFLQKQNSKPYFTNCVQAAQNPTILCLVHVDLALTICDSAHILPQAPHNMFHIVGVDVVSFQQATVAGALHCKLPNTDTAIFFFLKKKIKRQLLVWEVTSTPESKRQLLPAVLSHLPRDLHSDTAAVQTHIA